MSRAHAECDRLYGVAFSDADTWIAVGDSGTILRSTD